MLVQVILHGDLPQWSPRFFIARILRQHGPAELLLRFWSVMRLG